jgi:hypothetical protein
MKRKHFVPLCKQAMKILKEIRQLTYEEGQDDGLILLAVMTRLSP